MSDNRTYWLRFGLVAAVLLLAVVLRGAGVYRGVPHGVSYHPDAAKQVQALGNFLEGRYVWYTGLRFYDGYPLFLNHLDEWIIRPIRAGTRVVSGWTGRGWDRSPPTSAQLYYWTLTLRWLYGVVVVALTGLIARRLRFSFWPALGAMALVALSPVNVTVSHFATGDIACDLFFALAVWCAAQHARTHRLPWLAAAGLMIGWAFAGKYNAGLGVLFLAGYIGMLCLRGARRGLRFLGMGALSGSAFLVGVVIAKPQFTWAPRRTWRDMLRVIEHVRDYRAPDEYLELPYSERAWIAFSQNIGGVLWALGVLGLAAALAGLFMAWRAWREDRTEDTPPETGRRRALLLALFAFPWLVLLVSLKSKLHLHYFYFSWIYPAIALAAMYALSAHRLRGRGSAFASALPWVLALLLVAEVGVRMPSETYFWRREDIRTLARYQKNRAVLPEMQARRAREVLVREAVVRDYLLEPYNVANFRNRPRSLLAPDAPAWRALDVVPLPVIPFGAPVTDWIVLNGPALPRSDRSFPVSEGRDFKVILVTHDPMPEIRLGIQTGLYPAAFRGRLGAQRFEGRLGAHDWRVVPLEDLRPTRIMQDRGRSERMIHHYRFRVRSDMGPVWITLLTSPQEEEVFRLFGGDPSVGPGELMTRVDGETLADLTSRIDYRSGDASAGGPLRDAPDQSIRLWSPEEVLPAGPYRLTLTVMAPVTHAVVRIRLEDESGRADVLPTARTYALLPGHNEIDHGFAKPFAPFQCTVAVEWVSGDAWIGEWNLRPDVRALTALTKTDEPPSWQRRFPDLPPLKNRHSVETVFGGRIKVHDVAWPEPVIPGKTQLFHARISLLDRVRHFHEYDVFLHLCDADGNLLMAAHVPADQFAHHEEDGFAVPYVVPGDIAPQDGRVKVGVWNRRTMRRLPVTEHPPHVEELRHHRIEAGPVRIRAR